VRRSPSRRSLFFNERGQIAGSASTSGSVTTFRDRSGRMIGTAERMRDGTTIFRDGQGRMTGSATAHGGEDAGRYIDALQVTIGDIVSPLWTGVILVAANPRRAILPVRAT
jgi:hypothetical protein